MTGGLTLLVVACVAVGAAVGFLTPLFAYRRGVEFGEPLRVACASCGSALPSAVRARCGTCAARLGPSRLWTVPVGALAFGSLAWAVPEPLVLLAALVMAGLALPLAAIDLAVLRLPDPLVLTGFVAVSGLLVVAAAVGDDWSSLLRAAEAGAVFFVIFLVLGVLPGAVFGFGDVKLGGVLGMLLGYFGWGPLILGLTLPWLVNGPFALVAMVRHGRRAVQPFGPALLAGSVLAIVISSALRG